MTKDHAETIEALSAYEIYPYASFLPTRYGSERFKRHKTLGHAKSAVSGGHARRWPPAVNEPAAIYQWDEQEFVWVKVFEYQNGKLEKVT